MKPELKQEPAHQRNLMTHVYFAPLFWTQFFGAFNDNIYKNSLIILITYHSFTYTDLSPNLLIPLSAGLFILPFFLFSALAGQIADKYEKSKLIRMIKTLEIFIMLLSFIAFYFESMIFLMMILFLMGCQSSLFGPLKYSILPQHLNEAGLMKANALIGMGTFVAILLGTILGGVLVGFYEQSVYFISFVVLSIAILGRLSSQKIPQACSANQHLKINWNIFSESHSVFLRILDHKLLLVTILAISWFWFLGATILTILPLYTKDVLHGEELVVTLLLAVFTIGIGIGTLIVGRIAVLKKSFKWIVLGIIGISLFSAHLYWNSHYPEQLNFSMTLIPWQSMFANFNTIMILVDMLGLGVSAGLYIVPLYVLLQEYSEIKFRSRMIAANNISNAFFMVCSALIILFLVNNDISIETFFILISLSNFVIPGLLYFYFLPQIKKLIY